jgi:hypothetical protein
MRDRNDLLALAGFQISAAGSDGDLSARLTEFIALAVVALLLCLDRICPLSGSTGDVRTAPYPERKGLG